MPFTFSPLPHDEAVARIGKLPLVSREVMDGLLPELRAYAFTITGLDVGDQMAKVRDHIKAVPAGEQTWAQAKKQIAADLVDDLGGKASQRRAELLLRTHVFRSYAATRYRNLMQQVDAFPFWQYKTHGDGNVRPSHAALNGKIFPAGHDIWQRIFPPWDWGCRCIVVPLTARSADQVMQRGKISDAAASDAHLLPTQIAKPEIFTDAEATIIDKNQRLPGGIPLNRTPTWSDSPWSIPGNVHHDWKLIEARYADQPEVLAAWKQWADKQEITPGRTVSMWISDTQAAQVLPKLTLKKKFQQPATPAATPAATPPRSLKDVSAAVDALMPEHAALVKRLEAAQLKVAKGVYGTAQYDQAKQEVLAARAEMEALREKGRAAIEVPAPARGKVTAQVLGTKPLHLDAGVAAAERFTHADLLPKQITVKVINDRAFADKGIIHVEPLESVSTIAHEITHITECGDVATLQKSRDFLMSRRGAKELPKKLKALFPGYNYEVYEITIEDGWAKGGSSPYAGKLYFPGLRDDNVRKLWKDALKDDPAGAFKHLYATELLTVGIERLVYDPIAFALDDPDYFKFTVSTLQKLDP